MKQADTLLWIDILVLRLIMDENPPPSQVKLFKRNGSGMVNDWLKEHGVDPIYATPWSSRAQVSATISKLRLLGYLEPTQPYMVTPAGADFLRNQIPRRWQNWPLRVPIKNKELDFSGRVEAPNL